MMTIRGDGAVDGMFISPHLILRWQMTEAAIIAGKLDGPLIQITQEIRTPTILLEEAS